MDCHAAGEWDFLIPARCSGSSTQARSHSGAGMDNQARYLVRPSQALASALTMLAACAAPRLAEDRACLEQARASVPSQMQVAPVLMQMGYLVWKAALMLKVRCPSCACAARRK